MSSGDTGASTSLRESLYFKGIGSLVSLNSPDDIEQLPKQITELCSRIFVAKVNLST